ncbi:hypothetical protein CO046_02215 [Candidatus Peregrinibacteria bacterium CG_4_9_14_0_2_um_filter_53_11]|nr:MAG: hypothetical protein CO046_02215 [Candidatus Peregrinibacteria bacterium CG_4_9_14_0_2_um_filter_53_11]
MKLTDHPLAEQLRQIQTDLLPLAPDYSREVVARAQGVDRIGAVARTLVARIKDGFGMNRHGTISRITAGAQEVANTATGIEGLTPKVRLTLYGETEKTIAAVKAAAAESGTSVRGILEDANAQLSAKLHTMRHLGSLADFPEDAEAARRSELGEVLNMSRIPHLVGVFTPGASTQHQLRPVGFLTDLAIADEHVPSRPDYEELRRSAVVGIRELCDKLMDSGETGLNGRTPLKLSFNSHEQLDTVGGHAEVLALPLADISIKYRCGKANKEQSVTYQVDSTQNGVVIMKRVVAPATVFDNELCLGYARLRAQQREDRRTLMPAGDLMANAG